MKYTLEELRRPFHLTCSKCGNEATAYPDPLPTGTIFCPHCSPAWLQAWLEHWGEG